MRIVLLLLLLLATSPTISAKDWGKISPLHSSREDVERLLGKSKGGPNDAFIAMYETANETVSVIYSWKRCEKDAKDDWNVPLGTVLSISVFPRHRFTITQLGIDLSLFEKNTSDHQPDFIYYTNTEEGFVIEVTGERVSSRIYLPTKKDEHLRCK